MQVIGRVSLLEFLPQRSYFFVLRVGLFVESKGAMATTTFTTVSSLKMVLFRKALISLRGEVEIAFLKFYFFLKKRHSTKIPFSYIVVMIVLVIKRWFGKKFVGMAIWPFVLLKRKELKNDDIFMNHEKIHLRQQLELLLILFYIWYSLEFLWRLFQYQNSHTAYRNISFEREAYQNEHHKSI